MILSASYGSLQNPTFNFGLNFDDDADELPKVINEDK